MSTLVGFSTFAALPEERIRQRTAGLRPRRRRGHSERYGARGVVPRSTEVIDFFAPPRDDFLLGGKPAYMSEG